MKDNIKVIARTKHVIIEKRSFRGRVWYPVFFSNGSWTKYYTAQDAFRFARAVLPEYKRDMTA